MLKASDALIVVDYQRDFLPGGALAVKDGDKIAVAINRVLQANVLNLNVCTQDWHPADHCSFGNPPEFKDGSWPAHCVAGTPGAEISSLIDTRYVHKYIQKGEAADLEAYSGFQGTELNHLLVMRGIKRVLICGLATDYCVMSTALDARQNGFDVVILTDAIKGVAEETSEAALEMMVSAGCTFGDTLGVISHE